MTHLRTPQPPEWVREYIVRLARQTTADTSYGLACNLRPIVARAVRTGCGPRSLVGWVREQRQLDPAVADVHAVTSELTDRLVQWFLPACDPYKHTVRGV
jgi:hypothetical protein